MTLELKTSIEVEKSMKLIDINGKKISFQSDCVVKCDPKNPFQIAIVNQNDLDEGDVNFEVCKGSYSRRVKYESEDNEHINHYIAFKKLPNTGDSSIKADVVIQLTELQTNPKLNNPIEPKMSLLNTNVEQNELVPEQNPEVEILKQKLYELSQSNEYKSQNTFYRNIAIGCFILLVLFVIFKK